MWNGSRSGPQGGMPFRGEPRGGMFGRDGGRPDFRGRDGMNMDRPPMDVRRFDGPPDMRGQDMGFLDRGREPPRDFFGPGSDMNFRRPFEMDQRNSGGFMGQSRPGMNMNNRDMKGGNMRGPDDGFMNMDMRERLQMDTSGPPIDIRRRLAMVAMGGNGDGADMRNRERPMMGNMDGFGMNMPPRDRPGMDFNRWGSPAPNNHRGRFDSEMNMRSRMGSPGDFRDLPSKMFRDHDGVPMDRRGRPDMPLGHGGPDSMAPPDELNLRDRKFQDSMETPKGFRGRESESMCDDWQKSGLRDRDSAPPLMNRTPPQFSREMHEKFPPNQGNDGDRDHSFTKKDGDMFPGKDGLLFPPPSERNSSSKTWDRNFPNEFSSQMKPPSDPPLNTLSREGDALWQSGRDEKLPDRMAPSIGRPPFSKNPPNHGHHFANDQGSFRGSGDTASDHGPKIDNVMSGPKELVSSRGERCDQDYRDIDYRTSSGRKFEYNIEELQGPKKDLLEPKLDAASQLDSSQDQDYRASVVPDKVSKTIAISEIPKTATMQQILLAFAVRNGVPMQGMKIKDVVPGYSSDTAYVEFLNLEDAVHFMETNQGSVKVGDKTARLQYFESDKIVNEQLQEPAASMTSGDGLLPVPLPDTEGDTSTKPLLDPVSQNVWERNSNLTPEAWQQQVDQLQQQDAEIPSDDWTSQRSLRPNVHHFDPVFKESKTMIIKNILPTTTVETILKALEQYTYLDERNVRLVKGKSPGSKCFCFVDMDSHEHVTRLVDLLTKPRPIMIDGVRVYAEVAKPLKNQNFKRENEKSNTSLLGFPPDVIMQQQQFQQQQYFPPPSHTSIGVPPPIVHGDSAGADGSGFTVPMQSSSSTPSLMYSETMTAQQSSENQAAALLDPSLSGESSDGYSYAAGSEDPDLSAFLYDATSGFYYDPQTTLYYDPNSRYFYNAQNQQYLYWDSATKTYIPVQSSEGLEPSPETSVPTAPSGEVLAVAITGEEMKAASETSPDVEDELGSRSERKEKEKEEKPKSLAAFKIMKDMERWAKIQNRHKDSVRTPSPLLKSGDDSKLSKAADAAFAIFERKVTGAEDLFKKPLAPPKKEERGAKRPMGSLGMLAADYGAGSDEEEEEKHEKQETSRPVPSQPQADEREDRLTDWKKMACLLCRRQFPNKDALIRHQQLSDLHKQNMEIHLKIKRSKKELEALENQEKEMKLTQKESNGSPEVKRRKQSHSWAGGSRGAHKGSERPGLGLEPPERKKKEPVVWNHATYKQAVRKAMFARFNELD